MGKSGSGKGTQAKFLRDKFNFDYISSGDLLRARSKKSDFTGRKMKKLLETGGLAPMAVIFKLWLDRAEELITKKGFRGLIMDGNPRRLSEAVLIDDVFRWYELDKNVKAVLVDISDKEAVRRLTTRRICKDCKEIIPSVGEYKNVKKCPKCGGELKTRTDDNIGSVKNRLEWFKTDVQPIINYYKKTGRLIKIEGEQSIEDVYKDILKRLR